MIHRIAILMGSRSDLPLMSPARDILKEFGFEVDIRVMSAHRTPKRAAEFAANAEKAGYRAIICGAGGAAHLAGAVAANTVLPVIGVPLARTPLAGNDALLATVQMPSGVPVATVAVDGAANAALLAVQIAGAADPEVRDALRRRRDADAVRVVAADEALGDELT